MSEKNYEGEREREFTTQYSLPNVILQPSVCIFLLLTFSLPFESRIRCHLAFLNTQFLITAPSLYLVSYIKSPNEIKSLSIIIEDKLYILRVPSYQKLQKSNLSNLHISLILSILPLVISKPFFIFQLGHASNKFIDVIKNKFSFVKYNKSFCL